MSDLRKVRTLHLRAPHDGLLQRGAVLIEDGLRTASLPGAGDSRLLLVKRLSLGSVGAGASPATLSLLIEDRLRRLGASAVHAEQPGAESAAAVFFWDEVEPYVALMLRIALGRSTHAWFWKLAVGNWRLEMPRSEALRSLLFAISRVAPGGLVLRHVFQVLFQAAALRPLLAALQPGDGEALMVTFGWSASVVSTSHEARITVPAMVGKVPAPVAEFFMAWGETDGRSLWLASALLVLERPALGQSPALAAHALSLVRGSLDSASSAIPLTRDDRPLHDRSPDDEDQDAMELEAARVESRASNETRQGRVQRRSRSRGAKRTQAARERVKRGEDRDQGRRVSHGRVPGEQSDNAPMPATPEGDLKRVALAPAVTFDESAATLNRPVFSPTLRAGLFFLLPVMERIGLPLWLQEHAGLAGTNFAAQLLRTIAFRVNTAGDDPVWMALDEVDAPAEEEYVRLWIKRLREYCRRTAGIGLRSLVCRRGHIVVTPSHLDVRFLAGEADIRVRKAGLDLDPGWLPWFGRIVHFHYLSAGDFAGEQ
jgi:hypothetical protein